MSGLRRLTSGQWRREGLLIALALLESALITAWFVPLIAGLAVHRALPAFLGIAGLIALAHVSTRLLWSTSLPLAWQRVLSVTLILLTAALFTRLHIYPEYAPLDAGWIGAMAAEWGDILNQLGGAPVALVGVLLAWWRGARLSYRTLTLQAVSFSFRLSLLLLVVAGILWEPASVARDAFGVAGLIYIFFFASIVAMALARVEDVSAYRLGQGQAFGAGWWSIMLGAGALVVGLGWLLAQVYTAAGFRWLGQVLAPVGRIIGAVLLALVTLLARLLEPILIFLVEAVRRLFVALPNLGEFGEPMEDFPTPPPAGVAGGFPWDEVLKWSFILGGVALALFLIVLSLRRLKRADGAGEEEEGALLPLGEWRDDALETLKAGARRLADALAMLRHYRVGMELYAAISIRHIYANLVRTATAAGHPRHVASTPYEYLGLLQRAFAGVATELYHITDAYVAVHYGEAPSTMAELQEIREAWERVRAALSEGDSEELGVGRPDSPAP